MERVQASLNSLLLEFGLDPAALTPALTRLGVEKAAVRSRARERVH
jgi:hypothetical protein